MRSRFIVVVVAAGWAVSLSGLPAICLGADDDSFSPEQVAFFEAKIRPIFVEHCWKCHAADEKGGLRLDARDTALAGGDSGPTIVPGKPDESLMVRAVR